MNFTAFMVRTPAGVGAAMILRTDGAFWQTPLPIDYKGTYLDCGYRVDCIVKNELLLELKAVEHLLPIHAAQILTYLKLRGINKDS